MTDILNVFEYNQHFVAMMNVINAARINPPEGMTWKLIDGKRVYSGK